MRDGFYWLLFCLAEKNKKNELQIDAQRRGVKKNLRKAKHEQFLQSKVFIHKSEAVEFIELLFSRIYYFGWQGPVTPFIEAGRAQD